MSNIDEVIARSRQPGGFKERKRFTVARQRAIRKMRQFALADPHYYVLELIQAAVANQATHVDLKIDKRTFGLSYVGGGFTQEELAQLFDFLFASKSDFAHGDIRQLALGVNALMIMEPARIIIESGDGTMAGTTRIEIKQSENTVDVGTPDKALRGTFVRAEGLKRSKLRGKSNLHPTNYGPAECMAIENRCLAAPVPILVNDEPIFGYSSVRTPTLYGFRNVVTFDEGDLYGSIGIAQRIHNQMFKILTWGSWIQTIEHDLMEGVRLGGIVAFDRLNKTADHSGIVRDERLEQMWARLLPYAQQAQSGLTDRAVFQISPMGGDLLQPRELRHLLQEHETAVAVPPSLEPDGPMGVRAAQIGHVLDAPVLNVGSGDMQLLRNLAGPNVRVLRPNLTSPDELAFFNQAPAEAPQRPWIIGPVPVSPIAVDELVERLVAEEIVPASEEQKARYVERLGSSGELGGTIYTPVEVARTQAGQHRELWVRVRTLDRIAWQGAVTSAYPGHVLDIDVPAVSPSELLAPVSSHVETSLARLVAEVVARFAIGDLEQAARRALDSLAQFDIEPGSTGARVALAALARDAVTRLRSDGDGGPHLRFSLVNTDTAGGESSFDLLDVPVATTLDGRALSMRGLAELMEQTRGLVYGVVPEVEPDLAGLDTRRILSLDLETERLVTKVVGEGAYVRVDKRDVVAKTYEGDWMVRDVALGLRDFPDHPLLVEGSVAGAGQPLDESVVEHLVGRLIQLYAGMGTRGNDEELRRQAVRHLQYFACYRALRQPDLPSYGVETIGLFVDGDGRAVSLADVRAGFAAHGKIVMVDGRSCDVCGLAERAASQAPKTDDGPPRSLMMNTWVLGLLRPFGELAGAFDFDLSDAEAADVEITPPTAFVASTAIDVDALSGRIGLPEEPVDDPSIAVVSADSQHVFQLRQPAIEYGVVGLIRLAEGDVEQQWARIYSVAMRAGSDTLQSLVDRLAELDGSEEHERVLARLLDFAGHHLRLSMRPDGTVYHQVNHALAQRILDVPLFGTDRGIPVSAQRLINQFCVEQTRRRQLEPGARLAVSDGVPRALRDWLARHLHPRSVARPAAESAQYDAVTPTAAAGGAPLDSHRLARTIERLLRELRPDNHAEQLVMSFVGNPREAAQAQVGPVSAEDFQVRVYVIDVSDENGIMNIPDGRVRYLVGEMDPEDPFAYTTGQPPALVINEHHWLAQHALAHGASDPQAIAWLLLAAYGHINALLEPVTNDHELAFQLSVGDALEKGELGLA